MTARLKSRRWAYVNKSVPRKIATGGINDSAASQVSRGVTDTGKAGRTWPESSIASEIIALLGRSRQSLSGSGINCRSGTRTTAAAASQTQTTRRSAGISPWRQTAKSNNGIDSS